MLILLDMPEWTAHTVPVKSRHCITNISQTSFTQQCVGEVTTTLFLLCRGVQTVLGRPQNFEIQTWDTSDALHGCKGVAVLVLKMKSGRSRCGFHFLYWSEVHVANRRRLVLSVNHRLCCRKCLFGYGLAQKEAR